MSHSTHHKDTGEEVIVQQVEKCCGNCEHSGTMPDGCGECALLVDYHDGKPWMIMDYIPANEQVDGVYEREVVSHTTIGPDDYCKLWSPRSEAGRKQC